jgi:6-phosphogluconolactonase
VTREAMRILPDAAALARDAADEVLRRAEAAVAERGRFAIALTGGRTPRELYGLLADPGAPWRDRMPWGAWHVFYGDERCVPPDHPDSNHRMAWEAMLSRVPLPPSQVRRIRGELPPAEAARILEGELRGFFGAAASPPAFDLVLLGLGADGHVASLFPGSDALRERERLAVAVPPQGGHARVTVTLPVLNAARAVLFLVTGAAKAEALARAMRDAGEDPLPAQLVRPDGELVWLADAAAAARLDVR